MPTEAMRKELERLDRIHRREELIKSLKTAPVRCCATCGQKHPTVDLVRGECEACRNR